MWDRVWYLATGISRWDRVLVCWYLTTGISRWDRILVWYPKARPGVSDQWHRHLKVSVSISTGTWKYLSAFPQEPEGICQHFHRHLKVSVSISTGTWRYLSAFPQAPEFKAQHCYRHLKTKPNISQHHHRGLMHGKQPFQRAQGHGNRIQSIPLIKSNYWVTGSTTAMQSWLALPLGRQPDYRKYRNPV